MKKHISWASALMLLSMWINGFTLKAQPGGVNTFQKDAHIEQDLSSYRWKMKMMLPGQGEKQGLHQLYPEDIETLVWNPAKVPGDVYTDLWKVGAIEDPYYGRNSTKAQWVQHYEWWYTVQFNVTQDIKDKHVRIFFDGVDYSCDVWLNGHHLGSHEGAFEGFSFPVTDYVRVGKNARTSANMLTVKLNPPTHVNNTLAGMKTPWFGDYWRDLIPFGIWRPVRMAITDVVRIDDAYAQPIIHSDKKADINFEVTLENTSSTPREMQVVAEIQGKNFKSAPQKMTINCQVAPGKHTVKQTMKVNNPQLWWPWDLGKPNLYAVSVKASDGKVIHDSKNFNIGLRKVTSAWNPGFKKGVDVSFPRTTVINDKPIYLRSACWGGPPNIFVGRNKPSVYKELLVLAKEANLNNIRIFGWHNPEVAEFYEICDSLGLTVWQDMIPLGSGNIPRDGDRIQKILNSAVGVAKERRNHPSLIMMEGGEEYFLRTRDVHFANNFLLQLGDTLQKYLPLPYVPDSPLTCEASKEAGYKPKEAHHALAYFYGMGNWLVEDWYQRLDYPIIPEFAITSVPSVESLKKFIPEQEMWPPGPSWGHHWADLTRLKMQNFDIFGKEMANGTLEEFVNATQDAQGVIFQSGVEYFRRQKPRNSGVALCHWITYWPDMKWGIVDAYQKPKRSYDFVKKAYQPLLVSLDFKKRRWSNDEDFKGSVWIVNDTYETHKDAKIKLTVWDDQRKNVQKKEFKVSKIGENACFEVEDFQLDALDHAKERFYVKLELVGKDGAILSQNSYFFLIGDQAKASQQFKKMKDEIVYPNQKYTNGNYFRYFPTITDEDGQHWEHQGQVPRAKGFGPQ